MNTNKFAVGRAIKVHFNKSSYRPCAYTYVNLKGHHVTTIANGWDNDEDYKTVGYIVYSEVLYTMNAENIKYRIAVRVKLKNNVHKTLTFNVWNCDTGAFTGKTNRKKKTSWEATIEF